MSAPTIIAMALRQGTSRLVAAKLTAIRLKAGVKPPPAQPLFRIVRSGPSKADQVEQAQHTMAALRARQTMAALRARLQQ
jgi:hypothetical protein